ncbi:Universal stress protein A-like protein [Choanephora cucurbitarum]|uniref:Universal stress protein A-like protein n=1 Tax=Choanephora cucurbitarum TaxID=101091 RepID=A0A1C7NF51_9FUNG|nr:Universal stress protein A-like protein [Choanephora cucurbitarum]
MPNSHIVEDYVHSHKEAYRVIAVSIDEHSAEYIFEWATKHFIQPATDQVVLLNCRAIDGPTMAPYFNPTGFIEEFDETKKLKSHALLKHYADRLSAMHVAAIRAIALIGDPKHEIVRKVTEIKAEVLLLGSRQLSAMQRTFLGSVSDYCAHHAPCTVITIKSHPSHGHYDSKQLLHRKSQ